MNKLAQENSRLEEENSILLKSNEQFSGLTQVSKTFQIRPSLL